MITTRTPPPRVRRLASIGAIRKELIRIYDETKKSEPTLLGIQYKKLLVYILISAASLVKDEQLDDIQERLNLLETQRRDS